MSTAGNYLRHIHYFRAFAIVNIVIVHIWIIPSDYQGFYGVEFINIAREVAFHASTIYFLFISGFLFYYLSSNFEPIKYLKKKLIHVIFPYIFFTFCILIFYKLPSVFNHEYSIFLLCKSFIWSLIKGNAQIQYWYIPFVAGIFIISPLLLKIPTPIFKKFVFVFCLFPLLGVRTGIEVSFLQYIYFFPIYILGIYAAMDYPNFIMWIKKRKLIFILLFIFSSCLLIQIQGKPYPLGWIDIAESLYYIQKISICFLMLVLLQNKEDKRVILLDLFATYSFAIYFIHTLIGIGPINDWYYSQVFSSKPNLVVPLSIFFVVAITLISLFVCILLKKIIGKPSRYFIGA